MNKLFIIILLFLSMCLWAQNVPQTIDYQGRLADSDGNYLNSEVTVDFLIYDAETGGTLLWNESRNVSTANGIFHVLLGSEVSFPTDLFDSADRWLELIVSGETLVPRTAIASVPYAVKAETAYTLQNMGSGSGLDADLLDGQDSSDFMPATAAFGDITAVTAGTGLNGGGTSGDVTLNVDVPLNLTGNVATPNSVIKAENTSNGIAVYGKNTSSGNYGFLGSPSSAVYGSNFNDYGSGVYGRTDASTGGYGVWGLNWGNGNHGYIGSTDYGVYGEHDSNNIYGYLGSEYYGVYGKDNNSGNFGFLASSSHGVYGKHDNSGNYGLLGSSNIGVYGHNYATNGIGVYGTDSVSGNWGYLGSSTVGVYGRNYANSGYGIFGYNSSAAGKAVCGHSTGYYAGYFTASYMSGGTHVVHAEFTGTGNLSPVAVYGRSTPDGGSGVGGSFRGGEYGIICWSPSLAGYFNGNVHVTGTFTNPSDERFKENVQPFNNALSKIKLMNVHTFDYIQMAEEKQLVLPEGEQIGLIAQELEEILPELVEDIVHTYDKNEDIENAESDMDKIEYKGINYIGLIPVLIEAIKEQQEQIEELQQQIKNLE